ncbi:hypothetical protein HZB60_09560 [candidate division KSB1 bacterium]|nr:hypothetical protein [candidate division KSB1 bacterium]
MDMRSDSLPVSIDTKQDAADQERHTHIQMSQSRNLTQAIEAAVLRVLKGGPASKAQIATAVKKQLADANMNTLTGQIHALKERRQIKSPRRGWWELSKVGDRQKKRAGVPATKSTTKTGKVATIEKLVLNLLKDGQRRRSEIIHALRLRHPELNPNTMNGTINGLGQKKQIVRGEYGFWSLAALKDSPVADGARLSPPAKGPKTLEGDFYKPFAEWLVNDVLECTRAETLGGNVLGRKWGTPDVIGVYRVDHRGIYKQGEIAAFVSAEIKLDPSEPITAFGQACSYLLFSHKVYLVLPNTTTPADKTTIELLCGIVGLGPVFFDPKDVHNPDFEIRVRPSQREPDAGRLNDLLRSDVIYKRLMQ